MTPSWVHSSLSRGFHAYFVGIFPAVHSQTEGSVTLHTHTLKIIIKRSLYLRCAILSLPGSLHHLNRTKSPYRQRLTSFTTCSLPNTWCLRRLCPSSAKSRSRSSQVTCSPPNPACSPQFPPSFAHLCLLDPFFSSCGLSTVGIPAGFLPSPLKGHPFFSSSLCSTEKHVFSLLAQNFHRLGR